LGDPRSTCRWMDCQSSGRLEKEHGAWLLEKVSWRAYSEKRCLDYQELYFCRESAVLNRMVTRYLGYVEDQAANRKPMHMVDWVKILDSFLQFNKKNILTNAGKYFCR
jgi:hypothetical protein